MRSPFLTLGTVQLGLPYGLRKDSPILPTDAALEILEQAVLHGITCFDTASSYGQAEKRLGEARRFGILPPSCTIITKLPPAIEHGVESCIAKSLENLGQEKLDVLMLHRWTHRRAPGLWATLLKLRSEGLVQALGASVYTPEEAVEAASDPDVTHLQIPCNILDRRWENSALPEIKKRRMNLSIYARSIYLQGILVSGAAHWPKLSGVDPAFWIAALENLVVSTGRSSRQELCYAFVKSLPWVDSIVVGADNVEQLRQNLEFWNKPALSPQEVSTITALPPSPTTLLNPSLWETRAEQ